MINMRSKRPTKPPLAKWSSLVWVWICCISCSRSGLTSRKNRIGQFRRFWSLPYYYEKGKGLFFFFRGWLRGGRASRLLSRRNREPILQKWNEFAITTTREAAPSSLTAIFYWGNSKHFFWPSFILMKRWPRALQEMKAKAPPSPRGIVGGHQIQFFSSRPQKRRRRPKLIRSWRTK